MDKINSSKAIEGILEISESIANIEHLQAFMENMRHLHPNNPRWTLFEWWKAYLAWSEVSTEEDMEIFYGD